MKATVVPGSLVFEGVLDEETLQADLTAAFNKVISEGAKPPLKVDFSKVSYCNSAGIIVWIRFLREVKVPFHYVNAPIWLINQFNMIRDALTNGSFVTSFQAPYYCQKTQESRNVLLEVGKDVPLQKDYSTYKAAHRVIDGKDYEPDYNPQRYFYFISEHLQSFQGINK